MALLFSSLAAPQSAPYTRRSLNTRTLRQEAAQREAVRETATQGLAGAQAGVQAETIGEGAPSVAGGSVGGSVVAAVVVIEVEEIEVVSVAGSSEEGTQVGPQEGGEAVCAEEWSGGEEWPQQGSPASEEPACLPGASLPGGDRGEIKAPGLGTVGGDHGPRGSWWPRRGLAHRGPLSMRASPAAGGP